MKQSLSFFFISHKQYIFRFNRVLPLRLITLNLSSFIFVLGLFLFCLEFVQPNRMYNKLLSLITYKHLAWRFSIIIVTKRVTYSVQISFNFAFSIKTKLLLLMCNSLYRDKIATLEYSTKLNHFSSPPPLHNLTIHINSYILCTICSPCPLQYEDCDILCFCVSVIEHFFKFPFSFLYIYY